MIRCFVDKYSLLCASDESSIKYAIDKKMKEINKEDKALEETTIKAIISSCENLLDDLEVGNNINDEDMKAIIHSDNVLLDIQQRIGANLSPTNIKVSHYPAMTDRVYCDDEHGNAL